MIWRGAWEEVHQKLVLTYGASSSQLGVKILCIRYPLVAPFRFAYTYTSNATNLNLMRPAFWNFRTDRTQTVVLSIRLPKNLLGRVIINIRISMILFN